MLGVQGYFVIGCFLAHESSSQYSSHRLFEFVCNELQNKVFPEDFSLGETGQASGRLIPFVDATMGIDSNDGGIGCIDQTDQIFRAVFLLYARSRQFGDISPFRKESFKHRMRPPF